MSENTNKNWTYEPELLALSRGHSQLKEDRRGHYSLCRPSTIADRGMDFKRLPKWKTTIMEDNQNGRRPKWKILTKLELSEIFIVPSRVLPSSAPAVSAFWSRRACVFPPIFWQNKKEYLKRKYFFKGNFYLFTKKSWFLHVFSSRPAFGCGAWTN